jgi:hypothetical protein
MADDVTDPKPLRGGRQRSNRIVTHRVELGLWERKQLEPYIDAMAVGAVVQRVVLPLSALLAATGGAYWAVKQYGDVKEQINDLSEASADVMMRSSKWGQFIPGPVGLAFRGYRTAQKAASGQEPSGEQGSS